MLSLFGITDVYLQFERTCGKLRLLAPLKMGLGALGAISYVAA